MISITQAFSGFSVSDMDATRAFYQDKLGITVEDTGMGTSLLKVGAGKGVVVYQKPNHEPASFTVLNLPTNDVDGTVDELTAKGVVFERYEGFPQDDRGVMHDNGPDIAWFKDPSGNVISVISE